MGQQDFNPALLNDPGALENYSVKFEVRQPLFNPDMMMQRGALKNRLKSANEQSEGTKQFIQFRVRDNYYSLILHTRQLEVFRTALQTTGEHRRQYLSGSYPFNSKVPGCGCNDHRRTGRYYDRPAPWITDFL